MKNGNFLIKLISVLLILGFLFYYQNITEARLLEAEENAAQVKEIEKYNKEIEKRMAEDERKANGEAEVIEEGPYQNGSYTASAMGYGGNISLTVIIEGGYIDVIEVTDHSTEDPAYYMLAERLIDDMIEEQSAEVDAASGATLSSNGLISAVSQALEEAQK